MNRRIADDALLPTTSGQIQHIQSGYGKELNYKTFSGVLPMWTVIRIINLRKEEAFDKLLKRIHPGAIVLLHSTSSTNAQIWMNYLQMGRIGI